jgi:uncharacterized protein (TIGR03083 family)
MTEIFQIGSPDVGQAYCELRKRVTELCTGLSAEQWEQKTPHCPDWTVRETLAHLAGVVDDGINGNLEGVATEPWTAAQIAKRADKSGPEILEEWNTWAPFVEDRATNVGLGFAQMVFDAATHEHDLRFALAKPGARDSEALRIGLHFFQVRLPASAEKAGVPCPQIIVDGIPLRTGGPHLRFASSPTRGFTSDRQAGSGTPLFANPAPDALTLSASLFDVIRSIGSRRTLDEIATLNWSADPRAVMSLLLPFAPPATALGE